MVGKKNPIMPAILNFIVWGLGYLYQGQKIGLGTALVLIETYVSVPLLTSIPALNIILLIPMLAISSFLSYDAYRLAKNK